MKSISEAAKLSKISAKRSVRATTITLWSKAGVPNRHIMAISDHRTDQSLTHYNTRPSTSQLGTCSVLLSWSFSDDSSNTAPTAATAISIDAQVQENTLVLEAGKKTTSNFAGSLINNCTVERVHITLKTLKTGRTFTWFSNVCLLYFTVKHFQNTFFMIDVLKRN